MRNNFFKINFIVYQFFFTPDCDRFTRQVVLLFIF